MSGKTIDVKKGAMAFSCPCCKNDLVIKADESSPDGIAVFAVNPETIEPVEEGKSKIEIAINKFFGVSDE